MQKISESAVFLNIRTYIVNHKKISILIAIIILIAGYYTYKNLTNTNGDTTYMMGTAQKDTVVASITESGQVETNHQLEIKPKVSANVIYVAKASGNFVNQGDLIAKLDTTDAEKSVRDAQASLTSAQISLQKIQEPADQLTLLQAQNAVTQANSDLTKAYDDGFNNVSSAFIDLPTIISGIDGILHNSDVNTNTNGQRNIDFYADDAAQLESSLNSGKAVTYKTEAENAYVAAKTAYTQNFNDYKNTNRSSDTATISNLINETYKTTTLTADAVKSARNLIQYYQDLVTAQSGHTPLPKSTVQLTTLSGYTNTVNGDVSNLANTKSTITTNTTSIPEKQASLAKIQSGSDPLDIQSTQLSVTQKENALQDAKDTLNDYYIRAPFSGTLSTVAVKAGDPANSGTTIATLIANDQVATVTINEVDAAKIKLGNKVTLTFDAIDGLTLTGKVATIDTVGTVSSGVVNYTATISFDSTDPRVKPGMSVSASIITATALDVLTVPSSAVKSSANGSYVLVFPDQTSSSTSQIVSATPPTQQVVETGLSDDTNTEIISGLTEGQEVVIKTIAASAVKTTSATPSLLGTTGGTRTGGGNNGASTGALRGVAK